MNSSLSMHTATYRRSFVVSAVLSFLSLCIWVYERGSHTAASPETALSLTAVSVLGVTLLSSVLLHFFGKKIRALRYVSLAPHVLLLVGLSSMIIAASSLTQPYTVIWIVAVTMSAQWQELGVKITSAITIALAVTLYLHGQLRNDHFLLFSTMILCVPLIVALLGLTRQKQDSTDETLHVLAQELSQVSNKSDIIINAIGEGVIAIDNRGTIQLVNPAAEDITGWTNFDALNINYEIVLKLMTEKGELVSGEQNPVARVLHGGNSSTRNDLLLLTNSGKKINISLLVSPIGKFGNGAIIVFRDITKEVAENQEQVEFISTASHEMRTPVAAIEGYISLALNPQTATIDPRATQYLSKARESADHLGRLFQDLLDVSKAEDGRLKNEPQLIDAVDFVRESVSMLTQKATSKGLSLLYAPDAQSDEGLRQVSPTAYVNVDRDHLRETMSNLIENAIKYTKRGEVTINVVSEGDIVKISIQDSGIGIAPEDIPHLFQKFYRIDNTDTREIGGTGLGLYLCRRLVESMNGQVWVESKSGEGSTFYVSLPRVANENVAELLKERNNAQSTLGASSIDFSN